MNNKKKIILLVVAFVLTIAASVGVTLAWLTAESSEVTNTFAPSTIDITLTETGMTNNEKSFLMVPGHVIEKDPTVTVKANSEDCFVFIKVTKTNGPDYFLEYNIADGWTALSGVDGVYYKEVTKKSSDQPFSILDGDMVTVKQEVTKAQMKSLESLGMYPKLTFTAYACQRYQSAGIEFNVADAWQQARTSQSN